MRRDRGAWLPRRVHRVGRSPRWCWRRAAVTTPATKAPRRRARRSTPRRRAPAARRSPTAAAVRTGRRRRAGAPVRRRAPALHRRRRRVHRHLRHERGRHHRRPRRGRPARHGEQLRHPGPLRLLRRHPDLPGRAGIGPVPGRRPGQQQLARLHDPRRGHRLHLRAGDLAMAHRTRPTRRGRSGSSPPTRRPSTSTTTARTSCSATWSTGSTWPEAITALGDANGVPTRTITLETVTITEGAP